MSATSTAPTRLGWRDIVEQTVNGQRLRIRERPAAPGAVRLLLVHGFEESWSSWQPLADLLPDVTLLALDLPWRPNGDPRWAETAGAGSWLRTALGLLGEPVDLAVAHSFGAAALLDVLSRPGAPRFAATVLLAPLYSPRPELSAEAARSVLRDGVLLQVRQWAPHLPAERVEILLRRILGRLDAARLAPVAAMAARTAALDPAAVRVPTLIVGGVDDPVGPALAVRRLAARLPSGRLVQRADLSHFCQIEQPEVVADLLAPVIAAVANRAPGRIPRPRRPASFVAARHDDPARVPAVA